MAKSWRVSDFWLVISDNFISGAICNLVRYQPIITQPISHLIIISHYIILAALPPAQRSSLRALQTQVLKMAARSVHGGVVLPYLRNPFSIIVTPTIILRSRHHSTCRRSEMWSWHGGCKTPSLRHLCSTTAISKYDITALVWLMHSNITTTVA